jgi:PAS domain S-box-containing protein
MVHPAAKKKESVNHFEAFFKYATMGILVVDDNGQIAAMNPFALKEFSYNKKELLGKNIEVLIPPRYGKDHIQHREKYSKMPQSRPMGLGIDLFGIRKDGTEFPVEVSLGNYDIDGEQFVIAFITDTSVRKTAEAKIEKLKDELEATVEQRTKELTGAMHQLERSKEELSRMLEKERELGELKSRFVTMASHEFRTPLSTVLSSAYLIGKYGEAADQPKREKHLQRIISSVNMLTDILNDFLSVGKIEEGKIQIRLFHFSVPVLIKSIIGEMEGSLKHSQEIHYHHEGETDIFMDPSLLKHIVMNLISNAGKFSPETGAIEIKTTFHGAEFLLSVKDYGIGISREDQKHLMERFFRGANAGNIQGTGLGLHIVSRYAELMNGTVECKSELEKGTEFVITFKMGDDEKDPAD